MAHQPEHGSLKGHELVHETTGVTRTLGRNSNLRVVFRGTSAYTDGDDLVLPSIDANQILSKKDVMIARGRADHEDAHVRWTDKTVMPEINSKYGTKSWVKYATNCLEDVRIERLKIDHYPGSLENLQSMMDAVCEAVLENPEEYHLDNVKAAAPMVSTLIGRKKLGFKPELIDKVLAHASADVLDMARRMSDKLFAEGKTTRDAMRIAVEFNDDEPEPEDEQDEEEGDGKGKGPGGGEEREGDDEGEGETGEVGWHRTTPDDNKHEHTGNKPGAPSEDDDEDFELPDMSDLMDEITTRHLAPEARSWRRNENRYRVFSTELDTLVTRQSAAGRGGSVFNAYRHGSVEKYQRISQGNAGVVSVMTRKLHTLLSSMQRRDWNGGQEYGRLDNKRLVAASRGAQTVFKLRDDRKELDTAVGILIDLSGSMCGSKANLAESIAIALTTALEKSGCAVGVYGWNNALCSNVSSYLGNSAAVSKFREAYKQDVHEKTAGVNRPVYGRIDPLVMYEFKPFDERVLTRQDTMSVISSCADGNNSDPDAISWMIDLLKKRQESRKVLFVLSDGMPAVTTDDYDALNAETERQVLRAGLCDIECVGIGIFTEAVSRFYPRYVVTHSLEHFASDTFDEMAKVLLRNDRITISKAS